MLLNLYAEWVMREAALEETGYGIRIGGSMIRNTNKNSTYDTLMMLHKRWRGRSD